MSVTLLQKQNEEFMVAHRASSNGLNYTHFIKENPLTKVNHTSSRILYRTVGQINEKYRLKHRATRSSICSFARTAHSFTCSTLLASLARTAALICLLACLLHLRPIADIGCPKNKLSFVHFQRVRIISSQSIKSRPSTFK